jgi:hypothetical protein
MTSIRSCGCTYRDTGCYAMPDEWIDRVTKAVTTLLEIRIDGMTWAEICIALRITTHQRRDELHRILHGIATPEVTPTEGRGRRGTKWHLKHG